MPCHMIAGEMGIDLCKVLPAFHSITGFDSTSAVYGIGKKTSFKLLCDSVVIRATLSQVVVKVEMPLSLLIEVETFMCCLYGDTKVPGETSHERRHTSHKSSMCDLLNTQMGGF